LKAIKNGVSLRKAVLPAAGLGTRFLPATKASPKEMLPIVDKPLIQYAVEEAVRAGLDEFIIITGKNKRSIEDHFDCAYELEEKLKTAGKEKLLKDVNKLNNINFGYIRQRSALGLGHAVLCAKPFVGNEPFAVLLSDDLLEPDCRLLEEMINIYNQKKCPVIALQEVPATDVNRYGIIDGELGGGIYRIYDLVEKPEHAKAPSNLAIIGRYILTPEIFDILERQKPGVGGEIQLTDALRKIAGKIPIYGYPIKCKRYDAGEKLGYLKATVDFALCNPELSQKFKQFLIERVKTLS
jgi:UTP--glucose-1-phosphate uridylyltransferase